MKNILVTGGAGFIGSHFIKRLCKENKYNIANLDKLTYAGNKRNVENLDIRNIFYVDVQDEIVHAILRGYNIDTVIHFAAETHVDRSIKFPKEFLMTDVIGLFNLIYTSIKIETIEKFIFISTDEVYGDNYKGEADESFPLVPNSPYAASKAAADILLQSYIKTYNFPAIIIRPCNNYGPNQYPEKLIPMIITRILDNKKAILHGDGSESREWIYVDDCVDAIYEIMEKGVIGEIYNVGSGIRMNNSLMMHNLISIITKAEDTQKYIEKVKNRPGNDNKYAINSNKINELIGRKYVVTNIFDGLKTTVQWYENNCDWWPEIDLDSNIYNNDNYLR